MFIKYLLSASFFESLSSPLKTASSPAEFPQAYYLWRWSQTIFSFIYMLSY